jgi:hypothetical protein
MEYQVIIGRDKAAGVWFVRTTNVPGLALEDPSLDTLLGKLPAAISWVLQPQPRESDDVPYEYLVVDHETVHIGS